MGKSSPAIVVMAHGSSSVRGFSSYITREEAIKQEREEMEGFFSYTSNNYKTKENGIFTQDKIGVGEKEKEAFINRSSDYLTTERNEKRYMYKDVVSFDNDYLKEKQLIHSNGEVDVNKLSSIIQTSYKEHAQRLGMSKDYQLLGAVHLNTDNVHVHVGIVDKNINKNYTRPEKSLREIKSTTISSIEKENRKELQQQIDRNRQLLKQGILKDLSLKPNEQQHLLNQIKEQLPEDNSLHRMKSNAKSMQQPKELMKQYINHELEKNHKKEFNEFKKDLQKEQRYNERLYGKNSKNNSYEEKLNRFYNETGNKIFKDLSNERKIERSQQKEQPQTRLINKDTAPARFERADGDTRTFTRSDDKYLTHEKDARDKENRPEKKRPTDKQESKEVKKNSPTKENEHVKNGFGQLMKAVSKSKVGVHAPETARHKNRPLEQTTEKER